VFLTVTELALKLGVDETTIHWLRTAGMAPDSVEFLDRIVFPADGVDEWLAHQHEAGPDGRPVTANST
jgi:hypothetical protein